MSAKEHEDEVKEETSILPSKGPCFGQRHLFVILCNLGIAVMYCMRVNLNVALIAMVNSTAIEDSNSKLSNGSECPVANITSGSMQNLPNDGTYVWSRQLQGLILSSFFWGYLILQIPAGTLTQRFGGKRAFLIGVLWTSTLTAITPWVASFGSTWLICFRVLEGLGEGITFPTAQAMIGRWIPLEEVSFQLSIVYTGGMVGTIIGQLTSGPLCQSSWGWPSAFYVSGVAGLVWCLPWIIFVTDSPEKNSRISPEELTYIVRNLGQGTQETSNRKGVPWRRILTDRAMWAFVTIVGTSSWVFYVLLNCLPQYLSDVLQLDITKDGILSSLPYVAGTPVGLIGGYFVDMAIRKSCARPIYVRKIVAFAGTFGISITLYAVTFVPCNAIFSITLLVCMICMMNIASAGFSPNIQELSPEYCGTLLGIANSFATIAGIFAPYITDLMTPNRTIQQWNNVFYLGTAISSFGAIIYVLFASSTHRPWHLDLEDLKIIINEDEALIAEEVITYNSF